MCEGGLKIGKKTSLLCELHVPFYEHFCYKNVDCAIKKMVKLLQIQLFDIFTLINWLRIHSINLTQKQNKIIMFFNEKINIRGIFY